MNSFFVAIYHSQHSEWGAQTAAWWISHHSRFPNRAQERRRIALVRSPGTLRYAASGEIQESIRQGAEKLAPGWSGGEQHLLVWKRIRRVIQSSSRLNTSILDHDLQDAVLNIHMARNKIFE